MNTLNSEFLTSYRFFRRMGDTAESAAVHASREQRLRAAVADGSVRVRWEPDPGLGWFGSRQDYDPKDAEVIKRRIEQGRYEVKGLIIERRKQCSACGHVEWEHVDSLWGIVLDTAGDGDDFDYQRYLETEVYVG